MAILIIASLVLGLAFAGHYLRFAKPSSGGGSDHRADTEFTAEVVRLTRVLPHPNADRLVK